MKTGTRVKMSEKLKKAFLRNCVFAHVGPFVDDECMGCSTDHVKEFGDSIGIVGNLTDHNNCKPDDPHWESKNLGPEIEVRWQPDNLVYHYHPDYLVEVD